MDSNIALVVSTVLVSIVGIVVPMSTLLVKYFQDKTIAEKQAFETRKIAIKLEEATVQQVILAEAAAVEVKAVAAKVEETRANVEASTNEKLDEIHKLANSRLSRALHMIDELKRIVLSLAPDDPRVQELVDRAPP